ncbi:RHS repeat-associated core domain protein [Yersinia pestis PY-34]|nr:RHS repeat-associated core domain protein [Yersinia pestis PY-15]EIR71463.1 RHS repeat-associated core domain protein [Yersinia pestis PY-34]
MQALISQSIIGVPLQQQRRLLTNPKGPVDWFGEKENWGARLSEQPFVSHSTTDALGQLLTQTDAKGHIQRMAYNRAGQLIGSWLTIKNSAEQVILRSLTYSAAGQKLREESGNGVITEYRYEPQTQRLIGIKTTRPAKKDRPTRLQDLRYDYDPVGNILAIHNDAEATRFYRNQKIVPETTYRYDALYQLIEATGREADTNGIQNSQLPALASLNDSNQFVNYTRSYHYDRAGNLLKIQHTGASQYSTHITVSDSSNHGIQQQEGITARDIRSQFDAAGNQQQLQPGQPLRWNSRNQLQQVEPVPRNDGISDSESYLYDGSGRRVAKISLHKTHNAIQTRSVIYLAGLELRGQHNDNNLTESFQVITVGAAGRAQVRVLHWESGQPVDIVNDQLRYSFDNHLGSALIELDSDGDIISQEEYYPFGGTAVLASRNTVEAKYKTVRYSGKERDATGLYYYGYRYYQPWLGRWLSADPAGTIDGLNLYRMVRNNPIRWRDNNGLLTEEQINMYVNLFSNIGLKNDDELKSELLKYGLSEEEQNQIYLNMLRPMQSGSSSSLFSFPSESSSSSGSTQSVDSGYLSPVRNYHFFEDIKLATMHRPYPKKQASSDTITYSAEDLTEASPIKILIGLDLTSKNTQPYKSALAEKGIKYITKEKYEITDFFEEGGLSTEQIDLTVNKILKLQKKDLVGIHCGAGNGRSGVIASALSINKQYTTDKINSFDVTHSLRGSILKDTQTYQVDTVTAKAVGIIREINPKAVERNQDVISLYRYSHFLYTRKHTTSL